MSRDSNKARLFTRRTILIGGVKVGLLSLLSARLYYLQILQNERLRTLAEDNRINLRLLAPSRGQIFDRTGAPLAINQQNYRVVLLPDQVNKLDDILKKIANYVEVSDESIKRIKNDFKRNGGVNTVMVCDNLTWEQVSAISLHMPKLPGVDIEVGEIRTYPYGGVAAHAVGYVGFFSPEDKKRGNKGLSIPGFRIGKSAIERQYDKALRGKPGDLQLEMNAHGRIVRELTRHEPKSGKDIHLTIDVGLQQFVSNRLKSERSAAAVIMDIHTGAVYALVSHPTFDPNVFTYGIDQKSWDDLSHNKRLPLLNKVLDGVYAPGSTFKLVTAMAGLDSGLCNPKEKIYCTGHLDVGNHRFHCWKRGGHGPVNLIEAVAGSCDVYFYEMGKRIGIDRLHAMAKRLGLAQKTGIDFPHERTGLVPSRAWKMATRGASWNLGETLLSSIGQGYVLTTPLQLAVAAARISNGGFAVKPHMFIPSGKQPVFKSLGFDRQHLKVLVEALTASVNSPKGTAYGARTENEDFAMAGKTGTAQVRRISSSERAGGVRSNDSLPWKERDHALFVGFAPIKKPRYVASVIVEHGGSGARVAAPIVRDILVACQKRNPAGT